MPKYPEDSQAGELLHEAGTECQCGSFRVEIVDGELCSCKVHNIIKVRCLDCGDVCEVPEVFLMEDSPAFTKTLVEEFTTNLEL